MRPIDKVERALLGALIICPSLLEKCASLKPSDFSDKYRARVYEEIVALGEFADAPMVAIRLEEKRVAPPHGHGWVSVVCAYMDDCLVDDDAVSAYAQKIKEHAIARRLEARRT